MKCSEELAAIRDRWHCANHPFYERLDEGSLDIRHLGDFLVQHSLLVRQIFRSIGVTYSKSPDDIAYFILENLAEEAGMIGIDDGEAHDHRDLILAFTRYCDIADADLQTTELLPTWLSRAAYYWWITDSEPAVVRLAVQATQESQLVAENERAVNALIKNYGFTRESPEIGFFVEHSTADVKHGNILLGLVDKHATTPELQEKCIRMAERACKLRWVAFTELYRTTHLGEALDRVPD